MENLIDRFGEAWLLAGVGCIVGILFGMAAYHSRFCLRAATVEVTQGSLGPRLVVWLIAFFAALASVQGLLLTGLVDLSAARQLSTTGSLSGAMIGGFVFGSGMILARGCVSRLLVLSASGNLRAIVTGLVVVLVAQASLSGVLAPLRERLAMSWTISGGETRNIANAVGVDAGIVTLLSTFFLIGALIWGARQKLAISQLVAAFLVGLAVCTGWFLTAKIAAASFEVIAVQSVTFTGPSTDTLMALVGSREIPLTFGFGLVVGVFLGALIFAIASGEARIQRFEPDVPMERYIFGGAMMGFGSMLAGGCAVGAGLTGGSVLAVTAWLAVLFMWIGALVTQRVLEAAVFARAKAG
ncbi:YeeE/YedE family protein [Roseovarius rhodophyticola]|uniref:YeeE/YedE family protein n=1 Tax=Roseovarius rhodophyticola TaxID=3080827 RepID=A0ABZ2TH74_9RHOB|nr:YeeE/YedE family protein [Roseovarius sp. W115]MDV2931183.1 YeeE/YedE family protein [Roseovarius sp. W115]